MINMDQVISNSIIKRMVAEKDMSEKSLKKIYRRLCKITHPDLKNVNSDEFVLLQNEYEEAKKYLNQLKVYFSSYGINPMLSREEIKKQFYLSLKHYTIAGLHCVRIRIKPEIRRRNALILKEVLFWAKLYNSEFIPIFLKYNRAYFRRFNQWKKRNLFMLAQRQFQRGLRFCFDYVTGGNTRTFHTTVSYLKDAIYNLQFADHDSITVSLLDFAQWLLNDVQTIHYLTL